MQNCVSWHTSRNADFVREFYESMMLYDALPLPDLWALPSFAWDFHHDEVQEDFLWSHKVNRK